MILHIVSKNDCQIIQRIQNTPDNDGMDHSFLLLAEGVYLLADPQNASTLNSCKCYFINEDVVARGLSVLAPKNCSAVDYNDFVKLVVNHNNSVSW